MNRRVRMEVQISQYQPNSILMRVGLALAALSFIAILISLFIFVILPLLGVLFAIFLGVFFAVLAIVLGYMAYVRLRWYWLSRRQR